MATAAVRMATVNSRDIAQVEGDAPVWFEAGMMTALAFKTLARACCDAAELEGEWVSADEIVLMPF